MVERESLVLKNLSADLDKEIKYYKEFYYGYTVKLLESIGKIVYKYIQIKGNPKKKKEYESLREFIFLDLSYEEFESLKITLFLATFVLGFILSLISRSVIFFFVFVIISLLVYFYIEMLPKRLLNTLKSIKKGQLTYAILLMAIKLKETQNLEQAFMFAMKYIDMPLKLDFLNLLRDVVNKKYASLKDALDTYSKQWEEDAYFFVVGLQFLIASLYEGDPNRRELLIDKGIEEMIENLFISSSAFVRELQNPINLIGMLGITFPTLLFTVLPLGSVILPELIPLSALFLLFNVIIPFIVYINIKEFIENKRIDLIMFGKNYYELLKESDINRKIISLAIAVSSGFILFFILTFIVFNLINNYTLVAIAVSSTFVFVVSLSVAIFFWIYYTYFMKYDISFDKMNREVSSFLFTLGNMLSDGIPLEISLVRMYSKFKDKEISKFLIEIYKNLRLGQSLHEAIFNKKSGALKKYPFPLLEASMELILESSTVSPTVAGKVSISLAKYFTYMQILRERLLDLVAETTAQIKAMSKLLAPAILAVVTAITLMSLNIFFNLGIVVEKVKGLAEQSYTDVISQVPIDILNIFTMGKGLTPSGFFLTVGIFNLIMSILMGYMLALIYYGRDRIKLVKTLYSTVLISSVIFFILSLLLSIALWNFSSSLIQQVVFQ